MQGLATVANQQKSLKHLGSDGTTQYWSSERLDGKTIRFERSSEGTILDVSIDNRLVGRLACADYVSIAKVLNSLGVHISQEEWTLFELAGFPAIVSRLHPLV